MLRRILAILCQLLFIAESIFGQTTSSEPPYWVYFSAGRRFQSSSQCYPMLISPASHIFGFDEDPEASVNCGYLGNDYYSQSFAYYSVYGGEELNDLEAYVGSSVYNLNYNSGNVYSVSTSIAGLVYAMVLTEAENSETVMEAGSPVRINVTGEAEYSQAEWETHVEVSYEDVNDYHTVSYAMDGSVCQITASELDGVFGTGAYYGRPIKFRTAWYIKSTSTLLGQSDQTVSILYQAPLTVTSSLSNPACMGGNNGTITFTLHDLIKDANQFENNLYYSRGVEAFTSELPGTESRTVGSRTYYLDPSLSGSVSGTLKFPGENSGSTTVQIPIGGLPDGYFEIVLNVSYDADNSGTIESEEEYAEYTDNFLLTRNNPIVVSSRTTPYCSKDGTGYLYPTNGTSGDRVSVSATGGSGESFTYRMKRTTIDNYISWSTLGTTNEGVQPTYGATGNYVKPDILEIQITDVNDSRCYTTTAIPLPTPDIIDTTYTIIYPPECPQNSEDGIKTGGIELGITGGCGYYRYSLDGNSTVSMANDNTVLTLEGLSVGEHQLRLGDVTNANVTTIAFTIPDIDSLKYSSSFHQPVCSYSSAMISIDSLSGFHGTTRMEFEDDTVPVYPGEPVPIEPSYLYNFTLRDANECTISFTDTSPNPPPAIFTHNSLINPASCSTVDNGSVHLGIGGGRSSGQYTVQFYNEGEETATSLVRHYLTGNTTYPIHIEDDSLCAYDTSIYIPVSSNTIELRDPSSSEQLCDSVFNGTIGAGIQPGSYASDNYYWNIYNDDDILVTSDTTGTLTNTLSGFSAGTYRLMVSDDTTCFDSTTVTVGFNPNQFRFQSAPSATNSICEGVATGSVSVAVENATNTENEYTLRGPGYNNTVTDALSTAFNTLYPGEYSIRAEDAAGCIIQSPVEVGFNETPIEFTSIVIDPKYCDEVDGGTVTITTQHNQGGSIDSIWINEYKIYNEYVATGNEATFVNLGTNSEAVNLTLVAKGSIGCTNQSDISIPNLKNNPRAHITLIDSLACAGKTNGAVSMDVRQGVYAGPYAFTMNSETVQGDNALFDGLSRQLYGINILDANGCGYDTSLRMPVIAQPFEVFLDSVTPSSCIRAANGMVHLSGIGGKPNNQDYTFIFNNTDTLTGRRVSFENLAVGSTFTYRAFDNEDCMGESDFPGIIPVKEHVLSMEEPLIHDASCPGTATGSASLQTNYGNAFTNGFHYSFYSLAPENLESDFYDNNLTTVSSLMPGTYRVEVEDEDNCLASATFEIGQPQPVTLNLNPGYVARKGDATGWANATAGLGNGTYHIEWYQGNVVDPDSLIYTETITSNSVIASQPAGNYLVRVSDIEGCDFWDGESWLQEIFRIEEPAEALAVSRIDSSNVSCHGYADGTVEVDVSGGWGDAYGIGTNKENLGSSELIEGLDVGTYWVYVQDTAGVFDSLTVTITQPDPLVSSVDSYTDVSCFGYANGTVTLNVNGGTQPYAVSANNTDWTPGTTAGNLDEAYHTIYVRDAHYCTTSSTQQITEPEGMQIIDTTITDTRCGYAEGSIVVTPDGGMPGYTYQWTNRDDEPVSGNELIENLISGMYRLRITDNNGCEQPFTFYVSDITDMEIQNWNIQGVNCWGDANGAASMEVVRGFSPYSISWPNGQTGNSAENLEAGTYVVSIEDNEGCWLFEDFTITSPDSLYSASITREDPYCDGIYDGSLTLEASGGSPGYTYLWNTGRTQPTIRNLEAGLYTVTLSDAHGCEKVYSFNMDYQTGVETALKDLVTVCKGNEFLLDPGEFLFYRWSHGDEIISNEQVLKVTDAGIYAVEVEDQDGCLGYDTTEIRLSETEFTAQAIMASEIYIDDTVAIFETSETVPDSMEIYVSDKLEMLEQGSYYYYIAPLDTGIHSITIIAYRNDCMDIQVRELRVLPGSADDEFNKYASRSIIRSFSLFPNPSDGNFGVDIELAHKADATLRLLSHSGTGVLNIKQLYNNNAYEVQYNLSGIRPDVYVLFLEAGEEIRSIKFIIL